MHALVRACFQAGRTCTVTLPCWCTMRSCHGRGHQSSEELSASCVCHTAWPADTTSSMKQLGWLSVSLPKRGRGYRLPWFHGARCRCAHHSLVLVKQHLATPCLSPVVAAQPPKGGVGQDEARLGARDGHEKQAPLLRQVAPGVVAERHAGHQLLDATCGSGRQMKDGPRQRNLAGCKRAGPLRPEAWMHTGKPRLLPAPWQTRPE